MSSSTPILQLRRAENLAAFKDFQPDEDLPLTDSPVSLGRTLSASIKRKFGIRQEETGRNRSLTASRTRGPTSLSGSSTSSPPPVLSNEPPQDDSDIDVLLDVPVPQLMLQGTPMTKISARKQATGMFTVDPDLGLMIGEFKHRKKYIIPLESIKELRVRSDIRYYREEFNLPLEYEDRWLTIVHIVDGGYKNLHLIAATEDAFTTWDDTLRKLHAVRKRLMSGLGDSNTREKMWEKYCWKAVHDEGDKLTLGGMVELCRRLSINLSFADLRNLFEQADVHNRAYLDFDDFRRFIKLLRTRKEVDRLYKKLCSKHGGVFDFSTFESFMREKQESSLTTAKLREIFERHSVVDGESSSLTMTSRSFTTFLLSRDNAVFVDQHSGVTHDMTQPLPDYYISSSHNTYLVGHQLVGVSTIEGYIRALLQGCRSVELDIYADPPSSPEPMITHGGTLTSKVPLHAVCTAIAQHGFSTSPYPIIISAEMHCTYAGQEEVVRILHEVFGDMLIRRDGGPEGISPLDKLPSPDDLKGKILFKTKNLDIVHSESTSAPAELDPDGFIAFNPHPPSRRRSSAARLLDIDVKEFKEEFLKASSTMLQHMRSASRSYSRSPQPRPIPLSGSPGHSDANTPATSLSPSQLPSISTSPLLGTPSSPPNLLPPLTPPRPPLQPLPDVSKTRSKMSPALSAILVYTVGVKFRGINKKEVYAPEHMFSLSERVANSLVKPPSDYREPSGSLKSKTSTDSGTNGRSEVQDHEPTSRMHDLIKHCRTHLVRVYPKGMRVNSTNYDPHRFWAAGAQLVALNWQTCDRGYMINHAMFQRNGRAGYVLKPLALRSTTPNAEELLKQRQQHFFDVTVISAQRLPRPRDTSGREVVDNKVMIDPLVEVSIHAPDWSALVGGVSSQAASATAPSLTSPRLTTCRTSVVKNNGFNPIWEETLRIPFDCVGGMMDLVFVRFVVREEDKGEDEEPLGVYCASLGSLGRGYRHLPLHDTQLSQYLFSTLFVRISVRNA